MDTFLFLKYLVRRVRKVLRDISTKNTRDDDPIPLKKISKKRMNTNTASVKMSFNFINTQNKNMFSSINTTNALFNDDPFLSKKSSKKKRSFKKFRAIFPSRTNDCCANTFHPKHPIFEPTLLVPRSTSIMQQLEIYNCYPASFNLFKCI
ncbi:hypothetical protein PORY_002303 [Pneumocystis oryctolagi]|uniref:Uncharacterized protein n=1 Tax=Pneumocystis oryctolagi TaxID=42067 RepID=A0ACB7CBM3_9ASCO|nr:hypothetical protein PORY_002303 [Pneumocystis oryctolagi]